MEIVPSEGVMYFRGHSPRKYMTHKDGTIPYSQGKHGTAQLACIIIYVINPQSSVNGIIYLEN